MDEYPSDGEGKEISMCRDGLNAGAWNFPFICCYVRGTKRLF
ncbi:hypothetical protein U471_12060 [Bacillus amyloliquefaciens CC178]|nr:hypothetical protein U471_12060 [Bacillus amyloliquefaciens CC178]